MKIGVAISILLLASPVISWHLKARVEKPGIPSFIGYGRVKVQLISGGAWDDLCGEAIADEHGFFEIDCSAPLNVFQVKDLKVYHRFENEKCKLQRFNTIMLNDGQVFVLNDSEEACENACEKGTY
ncbi:unnamed protein product [Bursaphelenchus xylophilus]|uniref:(pine wood nematode) hypothetical protein n=1 Tax=Bursaphelenchus xylophilus TaxID=6326 RepID=A0A1I7RQQ9_BURXY|nr:unnamed protein product [Bursaphelenchus xylophilus]CAG9104971.1 unnamed protein product [Bursaphelenchus xylophilus]